MTTEAIITTMDANADRLQVEQEQHGIIAVAQQDYAALVQRVSELEAEKSSWYFTEKGLLRSIASQESELTDKELQVADLCGSNNSLGGRLAEAIEERDELLVARTFAFNSINEAINKAQAEWDEATLAYQSHAFIDAKSDSLRDRMNIAQTRLDAFKRALKIVKGEK